MFANMGMKKARCVSNICYHFFMFLFCLIMIYPLIWMLMSSFKPNTDIFTTATSLIPRNFTIEHYINGWRGFGIYDFSLFFRNSILIAVVSTFGAVASSAVIAFGLARLKFPGKSFWFTLLMISMMLPGQVLMIPQFMLFYNLNMVGTVLPLTIPSYFGVASSIFMIMQFIRGIPKDMDEAARIDGCSWYGLFLKIHLPMIKPALATVAVLGFISSWQNFMGALLYLNKPEQYTVAYALKLFNDSTGSNDYGATFAMSCVSLAPILVLFFLFQKQLIEGISIQGLKG